MSIYIVIRFCCLKKLETKIDPSILWTEILMYFPPHFTLSSCNAYYLVKSSVKILWWRMFVIFYFLSFMACVSGYILIMLVSVYVIKFYIVYFVVFLNYFVILFYHNPSVNMKYSTVSVIILPIHWVLEGPDPIFPLNTAISVFRNFFVVKHPQNCCSTRTQT